ncbi:hypothetical protein [Streptomyces sp. NPDC054786]
MQKVGVIDTHAGVDGQSLAHRLLQHRKSPPRLIGPGPASKGLSPFRHEFASSTGG